MTNNGWRLDYALVHSELAGGRGGKGSGGGGKREDESDDDKDGEIDEHDDDGENAKSLIHDVFHLPHVRGSDHCPVGMAISAEGHGEELV